MNLLHPSLEACEWAKYNLDPAWLMTEWLELGFPGKNLAHLGFSGAFGKQAVRLGVLSWPTGARRFAVGHYLATGNQVDAIRTSLGVSGVVGPGNLTLDDGKRSVSASMWMLPVRPLVQIDGANGLNLITLVDDRFFWWQRRDHIDVIPGTTNWTDLYTSIGTALGTTIQVDGISADYLQPGREMTSRYDAIPILLDAVALCCGQRIVRDFLGNVRAMNVESSQAIQDTNLELGLVLVGGTLDLSA